MERRYVSINRLVVRHGAGRLSGLRDLICLACGIGTLHDAYQAQCWCHEQRRSD